MGAAALILSIIGVVLCWIPVAGWLGILLALVSLVLGAAAVIQGRKRIGVTAMILCVVGVGLGLYMQVRTIRAIYGLDYTPPYLYAQLNTPQHRQAMGDALDQALEEALRRAAQQDAGPTAPAGR